MKIIKIPAGEYRKIANAADNGSYRTTAVSCLNRMLDHVEGVSPGDGFCHVVVENAYDVTVLRVYSDGAVALVEVDGG